MDINKLNDLGLLTERDWQEIHERNKEIERIRNGFMWRYIGSHSLLWSLLIAIIVGLFAAACPDIQASKATGWSMVSFVLSLCWFNLLRPDGIERERPQFNYPSSLDF